MVVAGKMMCADIVNPNWIRASSSAVRPNTVPLFQYLRQLHPGSMLRRRQASAAQTEAALTIGLLTERSSSTTAQSVVNMRSAKCPLNLELRGQAAPRVARNGLSRNARRRPTEPCTNRDQAIDQAPHVRFGVIGRRGVCTENLSSGVVVVKSAKDDA
jgi:hypothetical protein